MKINALQVNCDLYEWQLCWQNIFTKLNDQKVLYFNVSIPYVLEIVFYKKFFRSLLFFIVLYFNNILITCCPFISSSLRRSKELYSFNIYSNECLIHKLMNHLFFIQIRSFFSLWKPFRCTKSYLYMEIAHLKSKLTWFIKNFNKFNRIQLKIKKS